MTQQNDRSIFNRSGLAALSDLETSEWRDSFGFLEAAQAEFISREKFFRNPEYKWPHDPLNTWSRVWEYPYVYLHLKHWRHLFPFEDRPRVLDLGSGVTFFPFSIARLGCDVTCVDIDPVCRQDLDRAGRCIDHSPGKVEFRQTDGISLPLNDKEVDGIYCISVLEHIPSFEHTVSEIARVLAPGGLLLLTVDLDLRGNATLGIADYKRLIDVLQVHFHYRYPEVTIHPSDLLHPGNGPCPVLRPKGLQNAELLMKEFLLKTFSNKRNCMLKPFSLAIQGFVMSRK